MYSKAVPSLAEMGQLQQMPPEFITRLFPWCTWWYQPVWSTWQSAGWSQPKGCLLGLLVFRAAEGASARMVAQHLLQGDHSEPDVVLMRGRRWERKGEAGLPLTWAQQSPEPLVRQTAGGTMLWPGTSACGGRSESWHCCVPPQDLKSRSSWCSCGGWSTLWSVCNFGW